MTFGQTIHIRNVDDDQKILKFNLGPAKLKESFRNLVHIVDLNEYVASTEKMTETINSIKDYGQHDDIEDILLVSSLKLDELRNRLNSLLPFKRTKRGLINGLGSAIKFITGNMDAEDANKLNVEIMKIQNEIALSKNDSMRQKLLNTKVIGRFQNITEHINNEQKTIMRNFILNANRIDKNLKDISDMQYLNRINYNIDILYNHITNIGEAIILAKLNIISKYILNIEELARIREIMEYDFIPNRQDVMEYDNSSSSMADNAYEGYLNSDEHIYELLELQAYYNETNIIFNFKIPILAKEEYNMYHIIPLPINKTKEIIMPTYILHNTYKLQRLSSICPRIEGVYYCNSAKEELMEDSTCLAPLLTGGTANCNLMNLGEITKIFQMGNNHIIFINIPKLLITSTCRTSPQEIQGTGVIFFNNCSIEINNIVYYDETTTYWDNINLIPDNFTTTLKANYTTKITTLKTLEQLNLDNLKNMTNLKEIAVIHAGSMYTALSTLLIIIIILAVLSSRKKIMYITSPFPAPAPTNSLWPSLYSKGGGVTSP